MNRRNVLKMGVAAGAVSISPSVALARVPDSTSVNIWGEYYGHVLVRQWSKQGVFLSMRDAARVGPTIIQSAKDMAHELYDATLYEIPTQRILRRCVELGDARLARSMRDLRLKDYGYSVANTLQYSDPVSDSYTTRKYRPGVGTHVVADIKFNFLES